MRPRTGTRAEQKSLARKNNEESRKAGSEHSHSPAFLLSLFSCLADGGFQAAPLPAVAPRQFAANGLKNARLVAAPEGSDEIIRRRVPLKPVYHHACRKSFQEIAHQA